MMVVFFFFFKQKTAYEMLRSLVGSEMCIRGNSKRGESPSAAAVSGGRSSIGGGGGGGGFPRVLAISAYRYVLAVENYHLARSATTTMSSGGGGDLSDPHHQPLVVTSPPLPTYSNNNSRMVTPWSFILPSGTKGHITNINTALSEIRRRKGLFPSESVVLLGEDITLATTTTTTSGDQQQQGSGGGNVAVTSNPSLSLIHI
eukprot:TRINITY_DN22663_c0_g1_i1.p1 TRINITY_DN22663_c0_g1~~TRINITY_DN22663_c0_g1_i1.p1  ORF type:complete len:202 (-),score=52.13 TRINITY_DN22663_c0_g1_i1:166-771(-)